MIYEFLRAVDLFDKSDLKFNGGQNLTIADSNSKQSIKYYFADKSSGGCTYKND